ncbi:MAG: GNAT family N-acetyltransferase [Acidimicrobiales bacterium]
MLRDHQPGPEVVNPEDSGPGAVHLGVVDDEGSVVAIATVFPEPTRHRPGRRAARLRGMAVDPGRQGEGLGSLLLAALLDRVRQDSSTCSATCFLQWNSTPPGHIPRQEPPLRIRWRRWRAAAGGARTGGPGSRRPR